MDKQVGREGSMEDVQVEHQGNPPLHLDPGHFTNQEAYDPSTPAKPRDIPDLSVIINSPIFHSKTKTTGTK
jgi:hypothetical protein